MVEAASLELSNTGAGEPDRRFQYVTFHMGSMGLERTELGPESWGRSSVSSCETQRRM